MFLLTYNLIFQNNKIMYISKMANIVQKAGGQEFVEYKYPAT